LVALLTPDLAAAQVAGQWETSEGNMTLREVGGSVQGNYASDNGRISGTLRGAVLEGFWAEDASDRRCSTPGFDGRRFWGRVRFTFQGDRFTGVWGYCDEEPGAGSWSGTRAGTDLPPVSPTAPQPGKAAHWRYLRTESGTVPYDPNGCYQPRVHVAQEGLVEVTITACGNPTPAQSRYRFEWTAPPKVIHPGKPFGFRLKATLTANLVPSWTQGASLGYGVASYSSAPPHISGGVSVGPAGNPHYSGESWSWDNLQRPTAEQAGGPPEWWATDPREAASGRKMRVNAVVWANENLWWSYVYELVDGPSPEPPRLPPATQAPPPSLTDLGSLWRIREANPQGQGCDGVWQRRPGTRTFDARWQCVGGPVVDVVRIESVAGDQVIVYREGTNGRYTLTLSPDRRRIVAGRIGWAPDWTLTGTIE
jgi:hypothetical protein